MGGKFTKQRKADIRRRHPKMCECGLHCWVPATNGFVVLASPEDIAIVGRYNWAAKPKRQHRRVYVHVQGTVDRRTQILARVLLQAPPESIVDHRNHNSLDNQRTNLRLGTQTQNSANRRGAGSSGFKGVAKNLRGRRWRAVIGGRFIGNFKTPEEAARAYDREAIRLYGTFAKTNFP